MWVNGWEFLICKTEFFPFPCRDTRSAQLLLMDRKGLVTLTVDCFLTELGKVRELT